jgi:nitroimidazol reductase NimA-like FMN-containing flavoprotein (pyridoxamine 5'-phosphate oxidase superfamily)
MHNYHPKRQRNEILDEAAKQQLLKEGKYLTLALCSADEPYIVTLSYGYDQAHGCLYFHCANKGEKLDVIRKNPKTCATLIKDRGYLEARCDHDYQSLVIRGRIKLVEDLAEKKHALLVLLEHLEQDPAPILARNIKDDKSYNTVSILKLEIEHSIGKQYLA